jgi:hypothetical protein
LCKSPEIEGLFSFSSGASAHTFFAAVSSAEMSQNQNKSTVRNQSQRVVNRLLAAVDRTIAAAEEAKQARQELIRLTKQEAGK